MNDQIIAADWMFTATVLGMAVVTYAMRAGGYWIMGQVPLTARVRRALEALPGAIIVSTILPIILKGGVSTVMALIAAILVMALIRRDFVAVVLAAVVATLCRLGGL
ncbi:branched-chain amino acid transport [Roseibium sp. TrichSKD4]|uniref:AzlD family protein n=1 Tax=Roseibium sp. TrichSKD4 TaxID=744980 RepID=UPI0001E56377|nr:AzlD domain-containing protein [Roseibium sp. TrichSKD4]EFO34594.1 branched-chain amino acid transport [Roseibium sp. TrichSKD4]